MNHYKIYYRIKVFTHQSDREWVNLVQSPMANKGFQVNNADNNIYMERVGNSKIICLTYVDYFLITTDKPELTGKFSE